MKKTTEQFIEEAKAIHGDKYDYSKTVYITAKEKVCIICPEHGEFWQEAFSHLEGKGCRTCAAKQNALSRQIWTEEKCFEKAKEYQETFKFRQECNAAYATASKRGWLKNYTWLSRRQNINGYWTEEKVLEEARKYTSRSEFGKKNAFVYKVARENGWLDKCQWFVSPAKKWNHETCYEEASKYELMKDFHEKSSGAYDAALDNKWLQEYTWLKKGQQVVWNKKWTYESCYEEAKKYKTKASFGQNAKGAYSAARLNGWLDDYIWFPNFSDTNEKVDSVYCYVFHNPDTVYVGRTLMYRQRERDIEHRTFKTDTIYKYAIKKGLEIPPMTILEDNLTINQGKEKEDLWRKDFELKGYKILNIKATGLKSSSIGALGFGKWSYEEVYEIALQFNSAKELSDAYGYLYKLAKSRNWLSKFKWFRGADIKIEKATKWTESVCRSIAVTCKTRTEFRIKNAGAYEKAKKSGWLAQYDWLDYCIGKEWNYSSCQKEASKYSSRSKFKNNSHGAYKKALKQGWLDDYFPETAKRILDFDTCKNLCSKYHSKAELRKNDTNLYNVIRRNKWEKELCANMKSNENNLHYTIEIIKAEIDKYETLTDFCKHCHSMHMWLNRHKIKLSDISDKSFCKPNYVGKKVFQYTKDGIFVRSYNSAREAATFGFNYACISAVCNGKKKSHKGFIFRFDRI